jgi:2-desacetyl-2-hydroxyethyl bacteriochlorophyllide A dehydrogenase
MTDKLLLLREVGQVKWEDLEIPSELGPNQVVAKSLRSLVSIGTELALYSGTHIGFTLPVPPFPMIPQRLGYALVGRVTQVGNGVASIRPGQRILMEAPHGTAGIVDTSTAAVLPLPTHIGDSEATLIRMAYIALTALRVAPPQLGEAAVIYGLGLVGQFAAQLYKLAGARPVIGIDRIPSRLCVAQEHGIVSLNGDEIDVPGHVSEITGGRGPEIVVEATGSAAVLPLALDLAAKGGRVVLLGSTRERTDVDVYSHIHRKGVRVIGAHESVQGIDFVVAGHWTKARNLQMLADLFAQGDLRTEGLVTHHIEPSELPSLYPILAENPQDYLGIVVDWEL